MSSYGTFVYDRGGHYTYINPVSAEALGVTTAQMLGYTGRKFGWKAQFMGKIEAQIEQVFVSGQPILDYTRFPIVFGEKDYEYQLILSPLG